MIFYYNYFGITKVKFTFEIFNHHIKIYNMRNLIILLLVLIISSNTLLAQKEKELVDYNNFDTSLIKELLVREINRFRAKHNLTPMKLDLTTDNMAQYDAEYVNTFFSPKSFDEMQFTYFHNSPYEGILLHSPYDRIDYFSSLNRVNRRLFYCVYSTGFSYEGFKETYYNFAITTLLTWLQSDEYDVENILKYDTDGEEFVGVGISFKEMMGGVQNGYEVYVNLAISTDK